MLQSEPLAGVGEGAGAIGRSLAGEYGLEADAEPGIAGQGVVEELHHGGTRHIRVDGGEGDARVVVDSDVDVLCADALEDGIAALEKDAPRPGRTRIITDRRVKKVVELTLHQKPANATQ